MASAEDIKIGDLKISDPYVRAMVPGAPVGGGYMTITNTGTTDDRLITASSPRAGKVEIHEMKMDNDVMIMRQLANGLALPAGKTVELKPGGYHVMFMKVGEPFQQGQTIKTTLTFEKAGSVEVDFPVGSAVAKKAGSDDDMSGMAGMADMKHMDGTGDAQKDIPATLKAMFETKEKPLSIEPVVVQGDWAVAGWVQDGRGGRALLKKSMHGWTVYLCSGDSLKDPEALEKIGIPAQDAKMIAAGITTADARLDAKTLALFSSFEGTVTMNADDQQTAGGSHAGHNK